MRSARSRRIASTTTRDLLDALESRQLLATGFNPDGPIISSPSQSPTSIVTADFDGDSKPDLVMSIGREIVFQRGRGGGKFNAPITVVRLNTDAGLLAVGDFNADGLPDIFSVEKGVVRGWHRMIVNTGSANFFVASYGRTWTAADTVTTGNIDIDANDEVLIEGRSPILTLGETRIVVTEVPDQIRVLDPRPTFILIPVPFDQTVIPSIPPPFSPHRFVDLGVAVEAYKLAQPVIAPVVDGSINNIVVGGQDPDDPSHGFIQVYAFADPTPQPGTPLGSAAAGDLPSPLFNPAGPRMFVEDIPTSFGVADMDGEGRADLVVTTLGYPIVPPNNPFGLGDFHASTLLFKRTGIPGSLAFEAPETLYFETLTGRSGMSRALVPEYRIVMVADLNTDGTRDVGVSIVEEFVSTDSLTSQRVARFVQTVRAGSGGPTFSTIVSLVTAQSTFASAFTRPQIFHASDVRRVGRPDLIVAEPPNTSGVVRVRIIFNVNAVLLQPHG